MGENEQVLAKIRAAKEVKGLSYQDIVDLTEQNGEAVSLSTVKRVFAKESDIDDFRYSQTIRPIIRAVLGLNEETPDPIPSIEQANESYATIEGLKAVIALKSEMMEKLEADNQKKIDYLKQNIDDFRNATKWYKRVIVALGSVCLFFMIMVFIDLAIGTIGWFRY